MAKRPKTEEPKGPATIQNRKARYDYEIADSSEAGIVLVGSEVKSLFAGRANLTDAYAEVVSGELWLKQMDIEPYSHAAAFPHERRRDRKLLMHRREINLLERRAQEKGFTLIPLRVYFKNGKAKVEVAMARGRRAYDKRDSIGEKDERRARQRGLEA